MCEQLCAHHLPAVGRNCGCAKIAQYIATPKERTLRLHKHADEKKKGSQATHRAMQEDIVAIKHQVARHVILPHRSRSHLAHDIAMTSAQCNAASTYRIKYPTGTPCTPALQ